MKKYYYETKHFIRNICSFMKPSMWQLSNAKLQHDADTGNGLQVMLTSDIRIKKRGLGGGFDGGVLIPDGLG